MEKTQETHKVSSSTIRPRLPPDFSQHNSDLSKTQRYIHEVPHSTGHDLVRLNPTALTRALSTNALTDPKLFWFRHAASGSSDMRILFTPPRRTSPLLCASHFLNPASIEPYEKISNSFTNHASGRTFSLFNACTGVLVGVIRRGG